MAIITPPSITTPPTAPQRGDRSSFSARVDAFVTWLCSAVTEFVAVASNVAHNADEANIAANASVDAYNNAIAAGVANAATNAATATTKAAEALASANAAAASAGSIVQGHGADIASASTINLTTATGDLVDVTGTTTITAITLADGAERTVRFTGALTLTHGASLVLPSGASITTAAGDFAVFRGYAAGVVRCVVYTKASGSPLVSSSGNGGATQTTSATSITLTSASNRVQSVNMTATGQTVTMPNATTLSTGGPLFVIECAGQSFNIVDSAASVLWSVGVGQKVMLFLTNNGTSAGTWAVAPVPYYGNVVSQGVAKTVNSSACKFTDVTMLTPTKGICAYRDSGASSFIYAMAFEVNGGEFLFGSPVTVAGVTGSLTKVTALTSTSALCAYYNATNGRIDTIVIYESNLELSIPGVICSVDYEFSSNNIALSKLSSTKVICCYRRGSNGWFYAVILDVSGYTITSGAVFSVGNLGAIQQSSIVALTSTSAICAFQNSSTGQVNAVVLTVSGSTITAGAITEASSAGNKLYASLACLTSSKVICVYSSASNTQASILDISGTTITKGPELTVAGTYAQRNNVVALSSTKAMVVYRNSGASSAVCAVVFDIVGSSVSAGAPLQTNILYDEAVGAGLVDSKTISVVCPGASSYLNAVALNLGVSL